MSRNAFLAVLCLLALSCRREPEQHPAPRTTAPALTVQEAKAYLERTGPGGSARTAAGKFKLRKSDKATQTRHWNQALQYMVGNKHVVEIPLTWEGVYPMGYSLDPKAAFSSLPPFVNVFRLLVVKDGQTGAISNYLVQLVGESNWLAGRKDGWQGVSYQRLPADFTGYVFLYGPDETFRSGFRFGAGKLSNRVGIKDEASRSGRLEVCAVELIYISAPCDGYDGCPYDSGPCVCGKTHYVYQYCEVPDDGSGSDDPPPPGGGTGGGSGGSGGSSDVPPYADLEYAEAATGIDCAVFSFTTTESNWQEAGVRNQRVKIVWYTPQGRYSRVVEITGDMVIGLPRVKNGVTISPGAASEIAKYIVDKAFIETAHYITSHYPYTEPDATIQFYFRSKAAEVAREQGGEATYSGRGTTDIITNEAQYVWVDAFNNCN